MIGMSHERNEERKARIRNAYQNEADIEIIPPKEKPSAWREKDLRVAAYCRVSTLNEEQSESFEVQQQRYLKLISKHKGWTLVKIYADEGRSATSVKKRSGFLQMMEDCKVGKIDLIITKAINRFARNAVDCLTYTRMLKNLSHPVGVYFETQNINTIEQRGEMLLGVLASFAQNESEEKSESMRC